MKASRINNIYIQVILNGICGWIVAALIACLRQPEIPLTEALVTLPTICIGAATALGCCIGYLRPAKNRQR